MDIACPQSKACFPPGSQTLFENRYSRNSVSRLPSGVSEGDAKRSFADGVPKQSVGTRNDKIRALPFGSRLNVKHALGQPAKTFFSCEQAFLLLARAKNDFIPRHGNRRGYVCSFAVTHEYASIFLPFVATVGCAKFGRWALFANGFRTVAPVGVSCRLFKVDSMVEVGTLFLRSYCYRTSFFLLRGEERRASWRRGAVMLPQKSTTPKCVEPK